MKSTILCCIGFAFLLKLDTVLSSGGSLDVLEDEGESALFGKECWMNYTHPTSSFSLPLKNFTGVCYFEIIPAPSNNTAKISIFLHFLFLDDGDEVTFYRTIDEAKNGSGQLQLFQPIRAQSGSLTFVTEEAQIVIKLMGPNSTYQRRFEGFYQSQACKFQIIPEIEMIKTPVHSKNISSNIDCSYYYNADVHFQRIPFFIFESFSLSSSSSVALSGSSHDGSYSNDPPVDFFPNLKVMNIEVKLDLNALNDSFSLRIHPVNPSCSEYHEVTSQAPFPIVSPHAMLDNGTITKECRWILHSANNIDILGITFNKFVFDSILDIVSINNGGSELSPPLLQLTTTNSNITSNQVIRTTGTYIWIAFKPLTFASNFSANVTVHGQGGYRSGNGTIKMSPTDGNDTVFLLEVEKDQIVQLNFIKSNLTGPATIKIYDDFKPTNLLATLHGNIWYPVLSKGSKMMIIATGFNLAEFTAEFMGILPGCVHMSTLSTDSYILSGNCNRSCSWIIPPQDVKNDLLLLDLQYLSLEENDKIEIFRLDAEKTPLGVVSANVSHVPQLSIPADVGAYVKITRGNCQKGPLDVALVGHISYIPACSTKVSPEISKVLQVASPNYPDTYPLLSSCVWNVTASQENVVHFVFEKLQLAPNHCVRVTQKEGNKTSQFVGSDLPDDMLLNGDSYITFDSANCKTSQVTQTLASDAGFVLNVTVADCGIILNAKTGQFDTKDFQNKTLCIWKISIPATEIDKSVNIIVFSITEKDNVGNYELNVYNGASVREPRITNFTSETWSRTNNLIVTYKRLDSSKHSSVITFTYQTKSCNKSMQCRNGMCLHPDWRCNGVNECGDYTDELNCGSIPIPPEVKSTGISTTTFAVTIVAFFGIGIGLAIIIPLLYRKYQNGQYRRFGDISVIE